MGREKVREVSTASTTVTIRHGKDLQTEHSCAVDMRAILAVAVGTWFLRATLIDNIDRIKCLQNTTFVALRAMRAMFCEVPRAMSPICIWVYWHRCLVTSPLKATATADDWRPWEKKRMLEFFQNLFRGSANRRVAYISRSDGKGVESL